MPEPEEKKYDYWYWYDIRQFLLTRDGQCGYCGLELNRFNITIDHMTPRSKGGTNEMHNLVACCGDCNEEKDNLLPLEYIQKRLNEEEQKRNWCLITGAKAARIE